VKGGYAKVSHCFNMEERNKDKPECYGRLSKVFPMGDQGLRETPESCFQCVHIRDCLKEAIQGPEGLKLREERVDRAYRSGQIGLFRRWSEKKLIHNMKKAIKNE